MNWLTSSLQAAQQAASNLATSDLAEKARQLAQEASAKAAMLAQEASLKAQEVAKEARGVAQEALTGAERSLKELTTGASSQSSAQAQAVDPLVYGITNELQQFVSSLTYMTFSDYPMETLPTPDEAGNTKGRLSPWQETHARLMLERAPQLRDLRFVLCPRKLDEYDFWMIYFTLCRRYLPKEAFQAPTAAAAATRQASVASGGSEAAGMPAAAAGPTSAGARPSSTQGMAEHRGSSAGTTGGTGSAAGAGAAAAGAAAAAAAAAAQSEVEDYQDAGAGGADSLADLAADPELDAYLQEALAVGGGSEGGDAGGSEDVGDLDEYINALEGDEGSK